MCSIHPVTQCFLVSVVIDTDNAAQHFKSKTSLFWLTTLPDRLKLEFDIDVPSVMWDFGAPGHGKVSDQ